MKDYKAKCKILIQYFILPLVIFILFEKFIYGILDKYFVEPILSLCYPSSSSYDISIGVLFLLLLLPVLIKLFYYKAKLTLRLKLICLLATFYYISCRFSENPFFVFTPFKTFPKLMLLDLVFAFPALVFISSLAIFLYHASINIIEKISSLMKKKNENDESKEDLPKGFLVDEVKDIKNDKDLLKSNKFVQGVVNQINITDSPNGSFAIGIVGKWGIGKSTVVKSIVSTLEGQKEIIVEFNVWKCNNASQIIETIFKELKTKLTPYSFSINSKLQEYTSALIKGSQDEGVNLFRNLSELLFSPTSLENQYESINNEIKQIGRKIFIVIDDLDRLDKKEIYEVIRLIRNTANFANTFFIVAYDRNYLLNAIEEINSYQSLYFLEKIFQLEFTLPPIQLNLLQSELENLLTPILTEQDKILFSRSEEYHLSEPGFNSINIPELFLKNMRDVKRFFNSFKINYEFLKGEVSFWDFYDLELIRFKHPELFIDVYRNYFRILTTEEDEKTFNGNFYALNFIKSGEESTSSLRLYLKEHSQSFKIDTEDINSICQAYSSIFPDEQYRLSIRTSGIDGHLSVLKPSMFDRYFLRDIGSNLSEVEFSKIRQLELPEFQNQLAKQLEAGVPANDISEKIRSIRFFDDRKDFENIIAGIFFFANQLDPDSDFKTLIGYDFSSLILQLSSKQAMKLFNDDHEEYSSFLTSLLTTDNLEVKYSTLFLSHILKENPVPLNHVLPPDKLSDISLSNFKNALKIKNEISHELCQLFIMSEIRKLKVLDKNQREVYYEINPEAQTLMRNFVLKNDLSGFLLKTIQRVELSSVKYTLDLTLINAVFRSIDIFIYILKRFKGKSIYIDEYLRFYDQWQNYNVLEFRFRNIPVK